MPAAWDLTPAATARLRTLRRGALALVAPFALIVALAASAVDATPARAAAFIPNEVVVKYAVGTTKAARVATQRAAGVGFVRATAAYTRVLRVVPGASVTSTIDALRRQPDVVYAVPNYIAHASGLIPNDPGRTGQPGGWQQLQWNFTGPWGVNAPDAWANALAAGAPGARGVVVAVLDTGVAYANRGRFRRSPDFTPGQFVGGYDFVNHTHSPFDRNGHGTFVAGTIAEATNNGVGLTGLAYGARLMPVRVLNAQGEGDAAAIAQGVRYAANHGAQIINLSLEFSSDVTQSSIPELIGAMRYARSRGVLIVAASGNEGRGSLSLPARAGSVLAVGATTEHGCLSDFSNDGRGLALVAPGGGPDAQLSDDPNCNPTAPSGRDIYQETFTGSSVRRFGLPSGYDGTSMAVPHVAATAALVIATRVIGAHPSPDAITARLEATALHLGPPGRNIRYGYGLVNAAAATAPGPPQAAQPPATPSQPLLPLPQSASAQRR